MGGGGGRPARRLEDVFADAKEGAAFYDLMGSKEGTKRLKDAQALFADWKKWVGTIADADAIVAARADAEAAQQTATAAIAQATAKANDIVAAAQGQIDQMVAGAEQELRAKGQALTTKAGALTKREKGADERDEGLLARENAVVAREAKVAKDASSVKAIREDLAAKARKLAQAVKDAQAA